MFIVVAGWRSDEGENNQTRHKRNASREQNTRRADAGYAAGSRRREGCLSADP